MAEKDLPSPREPRASRPHMPGYGILGPDHGRGLLPWNLARERLTKGHNYWLATTRPDGAPHVMPVWGLWLGDKFYFSTGWRSRKARNLAANPRCVVCPDGSDPAIIVEGVAEDVTDALVIEKFVKSYNEKYNWNIDGSEGPIYAVQPRVAFAFTDAPGEFVGSATRWQFNY